MKYFIDTEFLEGTQDKPFLGFKVGKTKPTIDLISIGIVSEDDREYYAISKDFNIKEAWNRYDEVLNRHFPSGPEYNKVYWIRENVLKPIYYDWVGKDVNFHEVEYFTYKNFKRLLKKYGKTNKQIVKELKHFIYEKEDVLYNKQEIDFDSVGDVKSKIQLYGYYSAYDHVALCWLFGKMIDLPKGFPMYTIDLKQELDNKSNEMSDRITYESGNHTIWDLGYALKEIKKLDGYPKQTNEHNALADAKWNKELYEFLNKL